MLLVKQALTIKGHWTQCSLWLMPFLCGAANARDTQCGVGAEYERKGYERKGYEGAIYGQDMHTQDVEEQRMD
mgnify:FL=1